DGPSEKEDPSDAAKGIAVNGTTDDTNKPAAGDLLPVPDDAGAGSSQASSAITSDISDFSDTDSDDDSDLESQSSMTSSLPSAGPQADDDDADANQPKQEPWNAVCVVSLRVYSKDKDVLVQVITPKDP